MNQTHRSTGKSPFILLGLGAVIGGLAMASINQIVPSAHAQQKFAARTIAGVSKTSMDELRTLNDSFADLANFVGPTVVHIESESKGSRDGLSRFSGAMKGEGSGVIFRPDGYIITNDHVVNGFDKVTVVLNDGRRYPGKAITAPDSDIAVVKIDASGLPAAVFADSAKVRVGQFSMAVGAPFGLDNTVTFGHISALSRQSSVPDPRVSGGVRFYPDLIQTDASINMGNSGGPLMNIDGQVVGINSAIYSGTGGSVGIGFAIPSNQARMIAETLIEKGKIVRGALGLIPKSLLPYQLKEKNLDGGALVASVTPGGPADKAGIKEDDVIVRVGTFNVKNEMDVRNSMLHYSPGNSAEVELIRNGQHKTVNVAITDRDTLQKLSEKNQPQLKSDEGDDNPFGGLQNVPPQDFNKLFGQSDEGDSAPIKRSGPVRLGVGVQTLDDQLRKQYDIPASVSGVVVVNVTSGSVASRLGIEEGWVIQELNGKQVGTAEDLTNTLKGIKWGDTVHMTYGKFSKSATFTRSEPVSFR